MSPVPRKSLRRLLLRELLVLGAVVIPLVTGLSWLGMLQVLRAQAAERAGDALRALEAQLAARLERIEQAGDSLAYLWQQGLIDPARPEQARIHLQPLLEHLPGSGNIMLVRKDGLGFYGVRDQRGILAETIQPQSATESLVSILGAPGAPAVSIQRLPYQPLQRPWLREGIDHDGSYWSAPYLFALFGQAAAHSERNVGMTFVVPVHSAAGTPIGFVGIDVVLVDLNKMAAAVRPTPGSRVAVLDAAGRILGSSEPATDGAPFFLEAPSEGRLAVVHALLKDTAPGNGAQRVRIEGKEWLGRIDPLAVPAGRSWRVALAIPEQDLTGRARIQIVIVLLLLLGAFAAGGLRIGLGTRRLSASMSRLAVAARDIGSGRPPKLPGGLVDEIASVGEALQRSHEALQTQKRMEEQLVHMQRVGLVGFLAGGLAHDVNNLLTVVLSEVSTARATLQPGAASHALLEHAEEAGWRCVKLMRGLLGLSRRGVPSFRFVDVDAVLAQTASLVERALEPDTRLELHLAGNLPIIQADPIQLEQVVLNLALNARDAMPAGGVIRIATQAADGGVRIEVSDTGTGMSPETRARLFQPFFTTKDPGKGTGLGLAMVATIVSAHGGRIDVETEPGCGTRFIIHLVPEPSRAAASEDEAA